MNVGRMCTKPPVTSSASSTLMDVASLMRERNVGAVVITRAPLDRPVAVGMITDRDIVKAQLDHTAGLDSLSAENVMSPAPLEIAETAQLDEAIHLMHKRGVRRAPVVGSDGALVGTVSVDDLIASLAEELVGLASIVARQAHT